MKRAKVERVFFFSRPRVGKTRYLRLPTSRAAHTHKKNLFFYSEGAIFFPQAAASAACFLGSLHPQLS